MRCHHSTAMHDPTSTCLLISLFCIWFELLKIKCLRAAALFHIAMLLGRAAANGNALNLFTQVQHQQQLHTGNKQIDFIKIAAEKNCSRKQKLHIADNIKSTTQGKSLLNFPQNMTLMQYQQEHPQTVCKDKEDSKAVSVRSSTIGSLPGYRFQLSQSKQQFQHEEAEHVANESAFNILEQIQFQTVDTDQTAAEQSIFNIEQQQQKLDELKKLQKLQELQLLLPATIQWQPPPQKKKKRKGGKKKRGNKFTKKKKKKKKKKNKKRWKRKKIKNKIKRRMKKKKKPLSSPQIAQVLLAATPSSSINHFDHESISIEEEPISPAPPPKLFKLFKHALYETFIFNKKKKKLYLDHLQHVLYPFVKFIAFFTIVNPFTLAVFLFALLSPFVFGFLGFVALSVLVKPALTLFFGFKRVTASPPPYKRRIVRYKQKPNNRRPVIVHKHYYQQQRPVRPQESTHGRFHRYANYLDYHYNPLLPQVKKKLKVSFVPKNIILNKN